MWSTTKSSAVVYILIELSYGNGPKPETFQFGSEFMTAAVKQRAKEATWHKTQIFTF